MTTVPRGGRRCEQIAMSPPSLWRPRRLQWGTQIARNRSVFVAAPGHRVDAEHRAEGRAEALADLATEALEELAGVEVLPAEAVDIRLVGREGRDARVEGVGGVDPVLGRRPSRLPDLPDTAPVLEAVDELVVEHPAVAGVSDAVEHRAADRDVVGLVEHGAEERRLEVSGQDDLGLVPAYHLGDGGAQGQPVLDDAVGKAEELAHVDADRAAGVELLGLAHPLRLARLHAVDASLAGRH